MTYSVEADLVNRFGEQEIIQLTDRNNLGAIDTAVLGQALADADAEIDGYIGGRYTLPLAAVPQILTGYACDIARYRLYDDDAPEQVRLRYQDAVKFLALVGQGKIGLGLVDGAPLPASGGVKFEAPARVFNDCSLEGY